MKIKYCKYSLILIFSKWFWIVEMVLDSRNDLDGRNDFGWSK